MVSGLSKKGVKPPEYFNAESLEPMVAIISPELMNRGLSEEQAMGIIVNGFFEPFTRELPMEYASELNKLLNIEMEGSIG